MINKFTIFLFILSLENFSQAMALRVGPIEKYTFRRTVKHWESYIKIYKTYENFDSDIIKDISDDVIDRTLDITGEAGHLYDLTEPIYLAAFDIHDQIQGIMLLDIKRGKNPDWPGPVILVLVLSKAPWHVQDWPGAWNLGIEKIGTELMNYAKNIARQENIPRIKLDSSETAHDFYVKMGFRYIKRDDYFIWEEDLLPFPTYATMDILSGSVLNQFYGNNQ